MSSNLRRRFLADPDETPDRPSKKQKRNPPTLKTRVLKHQFRMSFLNNSKFNTHLAVPSFLGGKSTKRDAPVAPVAPVRNENANSSAPDVDLDLELSFASNMSLNSPARDSQPLTPEDENPNHVPMDISPIPPPRLEPAPILQTSNQKPFVGRPRAATSAARLFGRDMSNGHDTASQYSVSKSGTGTSTGKRLQRAALPTEWLAPPRPQADENSFSQVGGFVSVSITTRTRTVADSVVVSLSTSLRHPPTGWTSTRRSTLVRHPLHLIRTAHCPPPRPSLHSTSGLLRSSRRHPSLRRRQ